jgi:hypothetical protein
MSRHNSSEITELDAPPVVVEDRAPVALLLGGPGEPARVVFELPDGPVKRGGVVPVSYGRR